MARPEPAAGIFRGRRFLVGVEAGKIHAPDIAIFRRKARPSALRQLFHARPRKRQFDRPAAIAVGIVVHRAVNETRQFVCRENAS